MISNYSSLLLSSFFKNMSRVHGDGDCEDGWNDRWPLGGPGKPVKAGPDKWALLNERWMSCLLSKLR